LAILHRTIGQGGDVKAAALQTVATIPFILFRAYIFVLDLAFGCDWTVSILC